MSNGAFSIWYCDRCENRINWGEPVVLITGGEMVLNEGGPVADSEPWWDVYHRECYEQRSCK